MREDLSHTIKVLPSTPGVYRYFDKSGKLLYVGKAKHLKKRVSSYFTKNHDNAKTRILVRKIAKIEFTIVESEQDALFLENSLIKEFKPQYNILLKDDKTYPWICIKNEPFPRIFPTRNLRQDGSKYYGPYASVKIMNTLLDLIRQTYPLRTCNYDLSDEMINSGKYKVCLEYHIGNCKGPCINGALKHEYDEHIVEIEQIIKGKTGQVIADLKEQMRTYAGEMDFENANIIKEKINQVSNFQAKSTVVSSTVSNVDVFGLVSDGAESFVNYLHVVDGAIVNTHTVTVKNQLEETEQEVLSTAISQIRERFKSESKELVVSIVPEFKVDDIKYHVPQRGDKKKLLDLSTRNAKFYMLDQHKKQQILDPQKHTKRVLDVIQKDFRLKSSPVHIECFDTSNFHGTNAGGACVVFKNAKPSKKDYRNFNIKTVVGADDFASMGEVVYRRYKRLKEEGESLPQLIVIDGGKGQLSAAVNSLKKLDLFGEIAIVGIAKKLEEIFFPGDTLPLYIDKRSESLKVIQFLRNEAHRFGITHHRNKRSKAATVSELDLIDGVGEKTRDELLSHFKSIKRLKEAKLKEIEMVIGKSRAKKVYEGLGLK